MYQNVVTPDFLTFTVNANIRIFWETWRAIR